jgi:hypothetical protein
MSKQNKAVINALKELIVEELGDWLIEEQKSKLAARAGKAVGGNKQFVPNTKKAKVKTKQESYLEEDTDDTLYE